MLPNLGKTLIIVGVVFIVAGALVILAGRMPGLRIGRMPGDILYRRGNFTFYFPVVTSIVVSIVLTLLFWIFGKR
jgi:hypothetical protein